ncbi:unnamed protein product [Ambrosiozyma monospora]|uniref:Unnamed protein product n=1 Tax=Ambrosiozyma monospora TaxID=43982 RepID=A0A9W6T0U9_AMBMO|nr:unnamed protein product [Ambrosiozyma monospora]
MGDGGSSQTNRHGGSRWDHRDRDRDDRKRSYDGYDRDQRGGNKRSRSENYYQQLLLTSTHSTQSPINSNKQQLTEISMPSLKLEHTFTDHMDKCWSMSLHNKLPLLATVSSDNSCCIYNLETKQQIATLEDNVHTKTMRTVAFKPTGDFPSLAIGSFDSTVSIWRSCLDYEDLLETTDCEWELTALIKGHENEINSVDWSHDGSYLATCSRDKSIRIWEADEENEEFECVSVIQEHEQDVKFVKWHPYKNILASCSSDDTCRIFKQDDWECVADLTDAFGTIWSCDFEKKENGVVRLVNCSDDTIVRVWKSDRLPNNDELWTLESELPDVHDEAVPMEEAGRFY